ncbi:unnamed protein product [Lathyrus sativus]|nr:unnamed protein product [Lathyrus sativus]
MGVRHVMGRSLSQMGKEFMIKLVIQRGSDIEKMLNSFWWGGGSNNRSIRWEKLACSIKECGLGFRDFKAFNMSVVAKQGWNLMSKPHALVARIFKAGYFFRSSFLDANLGFNPSFMWKVVWKAKEVLSLGCRWSIGDGSHIKVMNEHWLRGKREGCLSGSQKEDVYNITVRNLMLPNVKQWNMQVIRELFDLEDAKEILQVSLLEDIKEDIMIWKEEQYGNYSVCSEYKLWRSLRRCHTSERDNEDLCSLWNIKAPPRVKHLIWRICKGCLPTRARLQQHYVPCPSTCQLCENNIEDDRHLFFGRTEVN